MKKFSILFGGLGLFVMLVTNNLTAQYYNYPLDTNLNDIVNEFYWDYTGSDDTLEGGDFRKFQKWENFWGPKLYPNGSFQVAEEHIRNYVDNYSINSRESEEVTANWSELGPNTNGLLGIGLINDIEFHPSNEDVLFCGSSGGGVWKSIDKGENWFNLNTDIQLARLGVSTIVVDPTDTNYIYIGTGDIDYEFCYSDGVYRSTDGGQTWQSINSGFMSSIDGLFLISKILVDSSNQNEIYVAGTFGIYKCDNRKSANPLWYKVFPTNTSESQKVRNIFFKPNDCNTLYGVGIDIIKSTQSGALGSWYSIATQQTNLDLTNTPWPNAFSNDDCPYLEIMNMAVGPHNQYLYVTCIARPHEPPYNWNTILCRHVFRFDVSIENWSEVSVANNLMIYPGKHELAVSPVNDSIVFAGGIKSYKTTTAGTSWSFYSSNAHVDYHSIEFSPLDSNELYFCTDGGIWRNTFGVSIDKEELNNGLGVATVYYFGTSETNPNRILSGMQDCGINYLNVNWTHELTSDGFECIIDYNDDDTQMYGTIYSPDNGSLYRGKFPSIPHWEKINNTTEPSYFGAPLLISSQNSKKLFQGRRDLRANDDVTVPYPINNWYMISDLAPIIEDAFPNETWFHLMRSFDICETDENYIFTSIINAMHYGDNAINNDCIIVKSENGGGLNEEDWNIITPTGDRFYVRDLTVSSHDPNKIWLTYSSYESPSKILESTDGGQSWNDYDEGLPDLPVNCITYEFGSNDALYVGTDVGVYYKDNSLNQWEPFMNGLPNVVINCLEINYTNNKIRAGTFGRGIWESDLSCTSDTHHIVIDNHQNWNRNYKLSGTLIIDSGGTLTINKVLNCTNQANIIVKRGGELIIDGGTITNNCGQIWQGIQVWGDQTLSQSIPGAQGKITITNGGTIENAVNAVILGRFDGEQYVIGYEGGIIQTNDAHFINNRNGVVFHPYRNMVSGQEVDNLSYFHNTEFLIDAELADESIPENFIHLQSVKGINIQGCTFANAREQQGVNLKDRGHGIYSEDANFTVTYYCPEGYPCEEPTNSVFTELNYGIKAYNETSTKTFEVNNSEFYNNLTGIYLKNIGNATIIFNEMEIRNYNLIHQQSDIFGGIYLDYCTGYTVEENTFYNDNPYDPEDEIRSYGITVNNSGSDFNVIYRNTFDYLQIGILAQRANRGATPSTGLKLKCNIFTHNIADIVVTSDGMTLNPGISEYQGASTDPITVQSPAGNLFSHAGTTYSDFNNTLSSAWINYYSHYGTSSDPWIPVDFQNITVSKIITYTNFDEACPPNFQVGGGNEKSAPIVFSEEELKTRMIQMNNSMDSCSGVLSLWIDGGNTPELNYEVQMATPPEATETYDQLIQDSPYLSDTVLSTSIGKEDVLVNAMIRDIMVANPHGAKKQELIDALEQRMPPVPDYMMAEIMAGLDSLSLKEQRESEIAYYKQERDWAFNKLLHLYLNDTSLVFGEDSLVSLISNYGSPTNHYFLALRYMENGDTVNTFSILSDVPNLFSLDSAGQSQHQDYQAIFGMLKNLKQLGKPLDSLSTSSRQILYQIAEHNSQAAAMAQNILQHIDSGSYPEDYILPTNGLNLRSMYAGNHEAIDDDKEASWIKVYPNPCKDYFIIDYKFEVPTRVNYTIYDQLGRTIGDGYFEGLRNQILKRTSSMSPGLYTIRFVIEEQVVTSLKLNIMK